MKLTTQKRLAGTIFSCSPKKVWLDSEKTKEIKEAITKTDVKNLIKQGVVVKKKTPLQSKGRARKLHIQKVKGQRTGKGSRKGKANARLSEKLQWMNKIRAIRLLLKELKDKTLLLAKDYRALYMKAKGGYFRNKRHLKLYINEHNMLIKNEKK